MIKRIKDLLNKFKNNSNKETEVVPNLDEEFKNLGEDTIAIEFGEDIFKINNIIPETIKEFRANKIEETGFIFPIIHGYSNINLQENELCIKVQGKTVLNLFVIPNETSLKKEIQTSLDIIYNKYLEEIFTYELTEKYLDNIYNKMHLTLFHVRIMYSINEIREIFIELLKNKKSIKNLYYIFGKIAETSLHSGFYTHITPKEIAKRISTTL